MKKHLAIAVCVAVVLVSGPIAYLVQKGVTLRRHADKYESVRRGMSRAEVIGIMGDGYRVASDRDCGVQYWDHRTLTAEEQAQIESTICYDVSFPYLDFSFRFSFDGEGKVIGKRRYD